MELVGGSLGSCLVECACVWQRSPVTFDMLSTRVCVCVFSKVVQRNQWTLLWRVV